LNPKLRLFLNLNEHMSVTRTFPIRKKTRMEFRAEELNVFNRVGFGTGSTQLRSATIGVLTGAATQINTPCIAVGSEDRTRVDRETKSRDGGRVYTEPHREPKAEIPV